MSIRNLEALFQPRSIAVIGASDRPGSVGSVVLRNLKSGGFYGAIWPVNRRHAVVDGAPAWQDMASLPGVPDLAVICTPAQTVPDLIAELGRKGVRAAIVMTAGLKQPVDDGRTLEQAMLAAAQPYLLRILGPNCIGLLVPRIGLNASFAPGNALPGKLAFVTQSGALATAMLDWANGRGIGFSHFISLGDSADVDFGDALDYLGSDFGTRAILMYAESLQEGRKFMSAARAAARNKPVIVVKGGRAPDGARTAASRTRVLASPDAIFDAVVHRAGMLRVDTLEALFDAAETLAHPHPQRGESLAIVTNGGGAGVLAADAVVLGGGKLAQLTQASMAALDQCLPATWSRGNPVDLTAESPVQRYQDTLRILLAAPEVDSILFVHAPTALVPAADIAAACLPRVERAQKPVLACWLGGPTVAAARASWSAAGIACFNTPERAVSAWLQLVMYARNQRALQQIPPASVVEFTAQRAQAQALIDAVLREAHEWLDEVQAMELLQTYGIPVADTRRAHDADEAARQAVQIGFPVALKIISPQMVHKSDAGGVVLNLASAEEVRDAAVRMKQLMAQQQPDAGMQGFAVQAMVRRSRELIVGLANDSVFGPVMLCGSGGTEAALSKQHAVALPPLNTLLARDLIERSGVMPLLASWRGRPPATDQGLIEVLLKVSQMACDLTGIAELDINPLLIDAQGVLALGAKVRVRHPETLAPLAIRPYPQDLSETLRLGGKDLLLRPIRPEDGERLKLFYQKAAPADMRLRFFMSRRALPASELARYSQIDYDREMTFVALAPADAQGQQEMVGEVRAVCDPDNHTAEFAIQLASEWQGRGLGRTMLARLVRYLRDHGTAEVVGECLPENDSMATLAASLGFTVTAGAPGGSTALRLALR